MAVDAASDDAAEVEQVEPVARGQLVRRVADEAAQGAAADQIPAIALTAYGRSEDRLRALQAGFNMHVAKPVDPAELGVVIASATTSSAWERKRKK